MTDELFERYKRHSERHSLEGLLEGHRALAAELMASLEERGYPDARPGHGAVFMNIDRRSGTRLTELARRARITKQGMMLIVDDLGTDAWGWLRRGQALEQAAGRVRDVRWGPRTLDVDVVTVDDEAGVRPPPPAVGLQPGEHAVADLVDAAGVGHVGGHGAHRRIRPPRPSPTTRTTA